MERLIEERVEAAVARRESEKDAQAARAARRAELANGVEQARKALAASRSEPKTALGSCARWIRRIAVGALGFGLFPGTGLMVHLFLIPLFGHSPGGVVCPWVCDGCTRSARVFSWNFRGNWHTKNGQMGYAFVCAHPTLDIESLTVNDVSRTRNEELQPYMLSSLLSWMAEVAVCVPVLALVLGPIVGLRRRRRARLEEPELERALAASEHALARFDGGFVS